MIEAIVLIFVGTTIAAALALFIRQPLLIVYICVGCMLGPHVLGWIADDEVIAEVGEVGIIFLLFVVGLELPPKKLASVLSSTLLIALVSSTVFFAVGFGAGFAFGYSPSENLVIGIAMMFSSTVIGIKLLPRKVLHHRHVGEVVIGLLLLQDVLAITAIVYLSTITTTDTEINWYLLILSIPATILLAFLGSRFIVWPLLNKFDVFSEFLFLLFIGWCLGIAGLAHQFGLGYELGAFIAGVALANSLVSQSVAETLEPLRDFFLVMFFFTVGARIDPVLLWNVAWQAALLGGLIVGIKPLTFKYLLKYRHEHRRIGTEVGFRLGQCSEFSLLVLYVVGSSISVEAQHVVLGATILSLVISTYIVVLNYKNPIAISDELRVD